MEARGDLYLDRYEGWYSVRDEAYYDDDELTTAEDGTKLSPQGTPVEWTVEESWFFRLSKYQQPLLDLYATKPEFIQPESRRNEVVRFVEGGLKDLSISRTSFDWGVRVPGSDNHVMYVWLDALTNYITGLGYPDETGLWKRYWPADVHLIGKDVVRFHAVYWPAFLMSAGIELPKTVYGHGFLLSRGEKMSKSVGNVLSLLDLLDRYDERAYRMLLLQTHYRSPVRVSFDNVGAAEKTVAGLDAFAARTAGVAHAPPDAATLDEFRAAMDDDLDTPRATALLFDTVRRANAALDAGDGTDATVAALVAAVREMCTAVGLVLRAGTDVPADVAARAAALDEARARKDYATADAIRGELQAGGWLVETTKQGTTVRPA
jgi:methionyl-tRNA synthetase